MNRLASIACIAALCAVAQTNRGGITGTVTDASGGVVPNAQVTIVNVGTNQKAAVRTSSEGAFSVQNLDPVMYRIQVTATGFKEAVVDDVKVNTATIETQNIVLQAGDVASRVEVSAEAPLVNAESGTLGQTISQQQIDNTPLLNRSVLDLAILIPNVSGDVGSEDPAVTSGSPVPGFNLNLNGGRAGSTLMLADGVNNTGVGIGRSVVTFSPETVQEFTVQTSAYSAEYGMTGGGVINVTTKSGTNQVRGEALWFNRNPAVAAAPYTTATTNRPGPTLKDNQFSLSAGGPIVIPKIYNGRNKTFFFGAIEPRYRRDHVQADTLVPTDAMRGGDFSNTTLVTVAGGDPFPVPTSVAQQYKAVSQRDATIYQQFGQVGNQFSILPTPATGQTFVPYPNNVIPPSQLDPVAVKLLQYMPRAQGYYIDAAGNLANYTFNRFLQDDDTRYTARIDHTISDNNRLSFRFTIIPVVGITGFGSPVNGNGGNYSYSRQFVLSDTQTISPTMVNDLRLNYTRGRFSGTFSPQFDVKTGENLSTELGLPSLTKGGLPLFNGFGTFNAIGSQGSTLNDNVEERYNVADTIYLTHGAMTWKFGVDLTHELLNEQSFYAAAGGSYSFRYLQTDSTGTSTGAGGDAFATFLLGVPNAVSLADAVLPYYYRWNAAAGFVQNDWKVKPNLTFNLGLRYSLQTPRTEKYNHQGAFLPQLAQSFPLAAPLTLANGQVVTSALVPPFGLDGAGGRSQYLWPIRWDDFEPRFGFAYAPRWFDWNGSGHLVLRGGYGLSHAPLTGQNRLPSPSFATPSTSFGETAGQVNGNYAMRLSSNPPYDPVLSFNQIVNFPSNGLVYLPSLNYQASGFVLAQTIKTPYSQNWNATVSYQPDSKTVVEVAYIGNKGTHLFLPRINADPSSLSLINALDASNTSVTATVADPLGRVGPNGKVLTVQNGSLGSQYLGFNTLYKQYDSDANSIRHAAYVSVIRRPGHGLFFSTSYTYGKSIDDASDASPDKGTLTTESLGGQVSFGGARTGDRSVSTFDVKHSFVATGSYELPFGKGKTFLNGMPKVLDRALGNWQVWGVEHLQTGYPFLVTLVDSNNLGDTTQTHTIRPDIVSGVPLVNPLWSAACPVGALCQPYLNPAAFERPAVGTLGNAPRTLDGVRGPMQQYLDASVQKNFPLREGRYRLQFRVDALNVLNHPVFAPGSTTAGTGGAADFTSLPSTTALTAAQYDAWAAFNGAPLSSTAQGAANLATAQGFVNNNKLASGSLPANFFTVPIPQGFATMNPNSFNIETLNGYKLYALRNAYQTTFGNLYARSIPRYIQFGLKFYF